MKREQMVEFIAALGLLGANTDKVTLTPDGWEAETFLREVNEDGTAYKRGETLSGTWD